MGSRKWSCMSPLLFPGGFRAKGKVRQKGLWRIIIDIDHKYFKIYPLPDLQRRKLVSFPASQNRILKICQPFHP